MHVMIDEPDDDMDVQIATHIVKVHQRRERAFNVPYTMAQVQRYIRYARSIRPQINEQVGLCRNSQHAEAVTAIHDTYVNSIAMSASIRPVVSACLVKNCLPRQPMHSIAKHRQHEMRFTE